jgi:hypothetical protein
MAKILFNGKNYNIDDVVLSSINNELKNHFANVMNGSGAVINLDGVPYNIDSTKLTTVTNSFISHLGTIAGNGAKVVIGGVEYGIDSSKIADAVSGLDTLLGSLCSEPSMAPGLYQAGAIALFREGNVEDASAMMTTSWDDLEASGAIAISEGEDIELPEMNEYGFYFGVPYSLTMQGQTLSFTFNEDGSMILNQAGQIMDAPAGSIVYGDHSIDMSALDMPVLAVSADGTAIEFEGMVFIVGSGLPPKGTVYLGTVNGASPVFEGDLVLPNDGRATVIADRAFYNQRQLTGIAIPDGVTDIGNEMFRKCTNLTSVVIPDSVTSIGSDAFLSCDSLTNVYITNIEAWCNISFSDSSASPFLNDANLYLNNELVTELTIPNTITEIKAYTFYEVDSLTSVVIPNSVTSIGEYAFAYCDSLTSVEIPNSVINIGEDAFLWCKSLTSVVIPNSVTSISNHTFASCSNLTSVTIPDSVTSIGERAFDSCSGLTSVTIGDRVTNIGSYAFASCDSLTSVTIGDRVINIGSYAFGFCDSLTSVTIPDSVTSIGEGAFASCDSLTSVIFSGTISEWNSIQKIDGWNDHVPATYVQCSDGQVAL